MITEIRQKSQNEKVLLQITFSDKSEVLEFFDEFSLAQSSQIEYSIGLDTIDATLSQELVSDFLKRIFDTVYANDGTLLFNDNPSHLISLRSTLFGLKNPQKRPASSSSLPKIATRDCDSRDHKSSIPSLPSEEKKKTLTWLLSKNREHSLKYLDQLSPQKNSVTTPSSPPLAPEITIKGFNSEGYWPLIQSLPHDEQPKILAELELPDIIERAQKLEKELASNEMFYDDLDATRTMFLAALLCLQQEKITKNQLASLHLLDSAIRTLYISPYSYLVHQYEDNQKLKSSVVFFESPKTTSRPTHVLRHHYDTIIVPNEQTKLKDLPKEMQLPLARRFFNFTDTEWDHFCDEMQNAEKSEQYIHILVTPQFGCWSSIIFKIQQVLKCMQILDWYKNTDVGLIKERIMVIPSFSMFQAAINAKAKTFNRKSVQLIPTYYYLDEQQYARYKSVGQIPVTMYLPERESWLQYNSHQGKFRSSVDGHPAETAFAGAIHDVYHAFRELMMSEQVSLARTRLAAVAKIHPKNQLNPAERPIDEVLVDGELIYCYNSSIDSIFDRVGTAQIFGDLFYTASIKTRLHDDLKRAFIEDMVQHKDEWLENFNIGKQDLRENDQEIYDEIGKSNTFSMN